jgi:hypothetical protein
LPADVHQPPRALDPAVKRRAADILLFQRPNDQQRRALLKGPLGELGFSAPLIERMVVATGARRDRPYGFTFSDLTQRLLPAIVLDAYPAKSVEPARALEIATARPHPPFQECAL